MAPSLAESRAWMAEGTELFLRAVGGVSDTNFGDYIKAGITAFGLGSSLYKPGMTAAQVADRARATVEAYDRAVQR